MIQKWSKIKYLAIQRPKRSTCEIFWSLKARNVREWFLMFYLDFLESLGPILLEKTIFGYSKAVKAVWRPSIGEIPNLQFLEGIFCFFRLQTSLMVYKITSVMILRCSFINNDFKSKFWHLWVKFLIIRKNNNNTSKSQ